MKKFLVLACVSLFASAGAFAASADANFTGSVATQCTVAQINPGTLLLANSGITTDTKAEMMVASNDPAAYKVNGTDAGDFAGKPNSFTGTATMTTDLVFTGANTGTAASGQEFTLTNSGNTTVEVNVAGSTDTPMPAGNYSAIAVISCVAI